MIGSANSCWTNGYRKEGREEGEEGRKGGREEKRKGAFADEPTFAGIETTAVFQQYLHLSIPFHAQ